jgi:hypothetical protein
MKPSQPRFELARSALVVCFAAVSIIGTCVPVQAETARETRVWGFGLKTIVGSGKSATETRTVGAFDRLSLQDGVTATVRRGATQNIAITADDNIVPLVETKLQGTTLIVRVRPNTSMRTKSPIAVAIDYTKLDHLKVTDGVSAEVDTLAAPSVSVKVSDGASLVLAGIEAQSVDVSVADGASARIKSIARTEQHKYKVSDGARLDIDSTNGGRATVSVSDGARFNARGLNASEVDLKVSDGAKAKLAGSAVSQIYAASDGAFIDARELKGSSVNARIADASSLNAGLVERLDLQVQDGGSVRYEGQPSINVKRSAGSSVRPY